MSASNKKKLRNEANAAKLTEKQAAEKKEAAKLKLYTALFAAALAVLVIVAAVLGINKTMANSGMREKNTIAVTIGSHKISNAELSYYYIDAVQSFQQNYGSYAMFYGLDTSLPLNEQVTNTETGETWADDFLNSAIASAQSAYAMADEAKANGYTLSAEGEQQAESLAGNLDLYAMMAGFSDADTYVKAMYGNGASKEGYLAYFRLNALANEYAQSYRDSLTFTEEEIRTVDNAKPEAYSSYSYTQYFLSANKFQTGGTTAEDGTTTYSDSEKAAAAAAAEEAAKTLIADGVTTVEELDAAIAGLEVNAETSDKSSSYDNQAYNAINTKLASWITDPARKAGDKTVIANTINSVDEAGNEVETVSGYYVLFFRASNDNTMPLVNVRHILVRFSDDDSATEFTDEQKAAAKAGAEEILQQWQNGEANEESFAALATEKTQDPGSAETGGLYEDIYPGQMVAAFNDWCFDEARKPGDTDIVETNYGYHVMFFVGNSDITYRDHMISDELLETTMDAWVDALVAKNEIVAGDTKYIRKNLVLASSN